MHYYKNKNNSFLAKLKSSYFPQCKKCWYTLKLKVNGEYLRTEINLRIFLSLKILTLDNFGEKKGLQIDCTMSAPGLDSCLALPHSLPLLLYREIEN
jgi:hypothetical protein